MIVTEDKLQQHELVEDIVLELMKLGEPVKASPQYYNNGRLREDIGISWPDGKSIEIRMVISATTGVPTRVRSTSRATHASPRREQNSGG